MLNRAGRPFAQLTVVSRCAAGEQEENSAVPLIMTEKAKSLL